jgi:AAA domain
VKLLESFGYEVVGGHTASRRKLTTASRTKLDDPSKWAPKPELVLEVLRARPNIPENFPTHNDFVRAMAAIKAALGPNREEYYGEVEEWALEYPGNEPEYVHKVWESITNTALGWDWLAAAGGTSIQAQVAFSEPLSAAEISSMPAHGGDAAPAKPSTLLLFDQLGQLLEVSDFVEGVLCDGQMSVWYGDTGVGKTFVLSDLALRVSLGWPWHRRDVERGGVVFVAGEGAAGLGNRVDAFRKKHGIEKTAGAWFAVAPAVVDFRDRKSVAGFIEEVKRTAPQLGGRVRLIVIDTLSRAMAGGNENSPDDMGALVTAADRIRIETGAHVAFIHHSGKDETKGARGHSLLRAAVDTEVRIERGEGNGTVVVRVTKQRDLESIGIFNFKLDKATLGLNRRGKPITSCVVEETAPARPVLSETEQEVVEILQTMLFESSETTVSLKALRLAVLSNEGLLTGQTPDAKSKQWQRLRDRMKKRGIICIYGDKVDLK